MTSTTPDRPRDLDALRALRASEATPTAAARQDARARLLERIERASADRAADATATRHPSARRLGRPTARRRLALALAAIAITAGAVGLGIGGAGGPASNPGTDGGGLVSTLARVPEASASEALRAAAAAAVGLPTIAFGPGSAWSVRTTGAELLVGAKGGLGGGGNGADRFAAVLTTTSTRITETDGSGRVTDRRVGPLRFTSKASEQGYEAAGRPVFWRTDAAYPIAFEGMGTPQPFGFGREQLSYAELEALPRETKALAARVAKANVLTEEDGTVIRGGEEFRQVQSIAELMIRAPLAPDLRAALWRVVATYDRVKLVGPTRDPAGREGIGVTIAQGIERAELVYAPKTGMLLSNWIYRTAPVTTCEKDLAPCGPSSPKTDPQGRPWRTLAAPGTVAMGTTVLSAATVPEP